MSTPILLPELGVDDQPVRIGSWLVDLGERVECGDRVVEVLVRGFSFDVAAPRAGVLKRIDKKIDAAINSGEILGWIDAEPDL